MFLNYCDAETQERILKNINNMMKKQKEKEEHAKLIKFVQENPPKSFKDMIIFSNLYQIYGSKLYPNKELETNLNKNNEDIEENKDIKENNEDIEENKEDIEENKGWFSGIFY